MNSSSVRISLIALSISLPFLVFSVVAFFQVAFAIDPALEAYRRSYKASREMELGRAFLEEGRKEVERGSYFRAISLLTNAINRGAGPEAFELRSRAFLGMGSNDQALSDLGSFISARPDDPVPYIMRAEAYMAMNETEKALSDYSRASDIDPFLIDAHVSKGLANISLERYESAISDFELALKIDPKNPDVLFNAAMTCYLAGMPKAARLYASRAIEANIGPMHADILKIKSGKSPETTPYEERSGGVRGILTETARLASTSGIRDQILPTPTTQDGPFKGLPNIETHNKSVKPKTLREMIAMIGKEDFSGTWAGVYMGMNWNSSFSFSGQQTTGVLRIITPSGKTETHYCRGTIKGNQVEASDQLGFRVSGRISDDLRFVGHISTPDGKTVPVDVPLVQ